MFHRRFSISLILILFVSVALLIGVAERHPIVKANPSSCYYQIDPWAYTTCDQGELVKFRLLGYMDEQYIQAEVKKCNEEPFAQGGYFEIRTWPDEELVATSQHYSAGVDSANTFFDPLNEGFSGRNTFQVWLYSDDKPHTPKVACCIDAWPICGSDADLVVDHLEVTNLDTSTTLNPGDTVPEGTSIRVKVHTRNDGGTDAEDFYLEYYDKGNLVDDDFESSLVEAGGLDIEEEYDDFTVTGTGQHTLRVDLDTTDVIPESDESNNSATFTLNVSTSIPTVFSGNVSSRLFFDSNGERINLEVCANNLPGQDVKAQLSQPGHTSDVVALQASERCVVFWDMDGAGSVLTNTPYTTRVALNQVPDGNWSVPCFNATGGQGLCDTQTYQPLEVASGYKLPYPGGISHILTRITHPSGPAFDFATPISTDNRVVASRGGRVVKVKEDSSSWGCSSKWGGYANLVAIIHPDNTQAYYLHFEKNGIVVKVGDVVQRGQLLGYTGLSGYMCGGDPRHVHYHVLNKPGGQRILVAFEDTNNAVPTVGHSHTSGNYLETLAALDSRVSSGVDLYTTGQPEGDVQFRLSNSGVHELKLLAYDYSHDVTHMRLAENQTLLQTAAWIPYTTTVLWTGSEAYVQYRTSDERLSVVYSDTIEATAYYSIQANFNLKSTEVCVGENVTLYNLTVPYCRQCAWQWDFGDGHISSQSLNPTDYSSNAWWENEGAYDYDIAYFTPGTFTITLSVTGANSTQTVNKPITVIDSISADFAIIRSGNTVFVEATEADAVSWEWDFGDGTIATGRTATHTYVDLDQLAMIRLTVQAANGCMGEEYRFVQDYRLYLPLALTNQSGASPVNSAPSIPSVPNPYDGATNQSADVDLERRRP